MGKLNDKLRSILNLDAEDPKPGFHSSAYHKHFEGYSEKQTVGSDGKKKITRVYTGQYYAQDVSDTRHKLLRALYLGCYVAAAILYFLCSAAGTVGNSMWYVSLPQALVFLAFFAMLYVMINYMSAPRRMDISHYKASSKPLVIVTRITAITLWLSAFMTLLHTVISGNADSASGILCILGYTAAGVMIYSIGFIESRIPYVRSRSGHDSVDGGIEIER